MIHLHNHTEYSQLDGLGSPESYAKKAKELGHSSVAITDHANVDGVIKFQSACKDENIKPIIGCEFYCVKSPEMMEKGEVRRHLTVLCQDNIGFANILKMLTKANTDQFYRRPRVSPQQILEHKEGLVFLSACSSTLLHDEWGRELFRQLKKDSPVFLEVMPHNIKSQLETNLLCQEFARQERIRLVASNDCHYPDKKYSKAQEVLLAIQRKAKWTDPNRWKFDIDDLYLKSREEMILAFKKQGVFHITEIESFVDRTDTVSSLCCDFEIERRRAKLPLPPAFVGCDETECLRKLSFEGFEKRMSGKTYDRDLYSARLEEELGLICELGFQRYFLIIFDLIRWCKENDVMTGPGRGSVGGSLMAYFLYITEVDPIKFGLLFSRFISPARIDLPDVDMDFEDIRRPMVREYLEKTYGKNCVAGVSTFLTMKGRCAVRDVSRVFDVPIRDVNSASKSIVVRSGGDFRSDFTIEDAFDTFEDGIAFKKKYPEVAQLSILLEGQIRGSGQHAAGICVSAEDLTQGTLCNLCRRSGDLVVNWDKHDIEHMGLMKLDILGISALTRLKMIKTQVKKNRGVDIDFEKIDLGDKVVYNQIKEGYTAGIFQIGSPGLSGYCKQLKVDDFDTLVHATSLWRPGTLRSGMTSEFMFRRTGEKKWKAIHPMIEKLTKDTYGIILYQEQVMIFMYDLAGLGWRTCDTVRKVMSKSQGKELFEKFEKLFVDGCEQKKTLDRNTASRLWKELASFGSYGFNKSHAVEYSVISFWDAYCKHYFPEEFFCASLTHCGEDKKQELVDDAVRVGITVTPPKFGKSTATEWACDIKSKSIFAPLTEIVGVGEKTAEKCLKEETREGFFKGKKKENKLQSILSELKFFSEEYPDEDIALKYLPKINLSKDKLRGIRGIIDHMEKAGTISCLERCPMHFDEKKLLVGKIPDLRFGYRQNVLKARTEGKFSDVAGTAESLGGAYGFFCDESGRRQMVFSGKTYSENKELVEHCEGESVFIEATAPSASKNETITCTNIATKSLVLTASFNGIKPHIIRPSKRIFVDCEECHDCPLRDECSRPVQPIRGRKNVVVIGEAPGRDEDSSGIPFTGTAGKLVLSTLQSLKNGISKNDLNWTTVVKCYPSKSKTPDKRSIAKCSKFLEKEIQENEICLALALGSTPLKFFKGEESGILNLSGTTEWDSRRNLWICWCTSPASVLYDRKNLPQFKEGIQNFLRAWDEIE